MFDITRKTVARRDRVKTISRVSDCVGAKIYPLSKIFQLFEGPYVERNPLQW